MKLGFEGERPWLYDARTDARAPDRTEWQHVLTATETRATVAEARATVAETRATVAEARATVAEARAQEEAQARATLEARMRALEAQLRRQQGDG